MCESSISNGGTEKCIAWVRGAVVVDGFGSWFGGHRIIVSIQGKFQNFQNSFLYLENIFIVFLSLL